MADKLRQMAQRLKDKVHLPHLANGRDTIFTKYTPATKVSDIADKFKYDTVSKNLRDIVSRYEKFTGVDEIMALQKTVVDAQLIVQERALRALFGDAEREERELFATMSAAVKLGHERERAHAERNKYWYIVASILDDGAANGQDNLANNLKAMQDNINSLVATQESLIQHLHNREKTVDTQLRDLTRAIVSASQSSQKSDAEITKALSAVHHDLEDADQIKEMDKNKVLLEPNQIITGVGIVMAVAIILGNFIGRVS
ncbi:hypothetical protein HF086_005384 [Spodoptera exigua]|uniref:Uncharacterized protein n=1 Tax=Spodoptera exigua TaxID=7107 RepID=A0A922S918_SPOEX|nr:hypothetical protein HF086_005384 [Spodoptera exigua]